MGVCVGRTGALGGGGSEDGLSPEPPAASTSRRSWRVLRRRPLPDRKKVLGLWLLPEGILSLRLLPEGVCREQH